MWPEYFASSAGSGQPRRYGCSYRRIAGGVLGYFESSVDETIIRMIGAAVVAIGIALIYFGIYVA